MDKKKTELIFIIDKSGSMSGMEEDTIGGFNSMLNKLKTESIPCRLSTVMFNEKSKLIHDRININEVTPLTMDDYEPGGMTALVDTTVKSIKKIIKVQKETPEQHRAEKVIFVIITDGQENSSWQYTANDMRSLILNEEEKYGWEFVFLGANIDAIKTAENYGIRSRRSANYVPDGKGSRLNYKAIADFVSAASMSSDEEDLDMALETVRKDMRKRGR